MPITSYVEELQIEDCVGVGVSITEMVSEIAVTDQEVIAPLSTIATHFENPDACFMGEDAS